jgi:flavin reductase (DIM6/NTAB) family NADH-FMN oxidoreductase RutF
MPDHDRKAEQFRQSMRRLASTVCVISCKRDNARFGITVTSVTPLSLAPLSIIACVNKNTSISASLRGKGRYCINVLRTFHIDVSTSFSGGLLQEERFNVGSWAEMDNVPYLQDAQASLFCEVDKVIPYATHNIIIGRVERVLFHPKISPLIYQNGGYAMVTPLNLQSAV